jgi:hypothetical protein
MLFLLFFIYFTSLLHLSKTDNNLFPMVFVHGLLGNTENEYSFGKIDEVYWENILKSDVTGTENFYEAKVSPLGSVHDRACQLYSSIRGLDYVYYGHQYIDNNTGLVLNKYVG